MAKTCGNGRDIEGVFIYFISEISIKYISSLLLYPYIFYVRTHRHTNTSMILMEITFRGFCKRGPPSTNNVSKLKTGVVHVPRLITFASRKYVVIPYSVTEYFIRGCIHKFPDSFNNEIYAYNKKKHSLRSNTQRVMAAKLTRLTHRIAI
jgi:hypothetical protein